MVDIQLRAFARLDQARLEVERRLDQPRVVAVAVDGSFAGLILLADELRPEAPAMIDALGRPYPEIMESLVLGPIGMTNSAYEQPLSAAHDLHAALAVILIGALWPMRMLRWVALALNTAMLVATPVDGSHYFIDVLTGIAIGILAFVAAHAIATRRRHAPVPMAAGKLPQLASGD